MPLTGMCRNDGLTIGGRHYFPKPDALLGSTIFS